MWIWDMFFLEFKQFSCHDGYVGYFASISNQTHKTTRLVGWESVFEQFLRFSLLYQTKNTWKLVNEPQFHRAERPMWNDLTTGDNSVDRVITYSKFRPQLPTYSLPSTAGPPIQPFLDQQPIVSGLVPPINCQVSKNVIQRFYLCVFFTILEVFS